jgi:hypothetical protein
VFKNQAPEGDLVNNPSEDKKLSSFGSKLPQLVEKIRGTKVLQERYEAAEAAFEELIENRKVSLTKGSIRPSVLREEKKILVPDGLIAHNYIGLMLVYLAKHLGWEARSYKSPEILLPLSEEEFFRGLWYGLSLGSAQNASIKKTSEFDLGRKCAWAQIVKATFSAHPSLGADALKRNQALLGNDFRVGARKEDQIYILKDRLLRSFKDKEDAEGVLSIISTLSSELALSTQDEWERDDILKWLRPFDEVAVMTNRPFVKKVGRKVETHRRGPSLPTKSPLLLGEELEVIHKFILPLWTPLTRLKEDWVREVLRSGWAASKQAVLEAYNQRWEILAKFAKLTTRRLVQIRDLSPEYAQLKKADISKDHLTALLNSRTHHCSVFGREVLSVIPSDAIERLGWILYKADRISESSLHQAIAVTISSGYAKVGIGHDYPEAWKTPDEEVKETELAQVGNLLEPCLSRIATVRSALKVVLSNRFNKKRLTLLRRTVDNLRTDLGKVDQLGAEAITIYGRYREPPMRILEVVKKRVRDMNREINEAKAQCIILGKVAKLSVSADELAALLI